MVGPNASALVLCQHYSTELARRPSSCIDLRLAEVAQSATLRAWYLRVLTQLAATLAAFGNALDHHYLNAIAELRPNHTRPIPTSKLLHLLNDIRWLLAVPGAHPSGDFVYSEDVLPNS